MAQALVETLAARLLAICLALAGLSQVAAADQMPEPKQSAHSFSGQFSRQVSTSYLLYLPPEAHQGNGRKWPLLIFLHGSGERGDDLARVKVHGPPREIEAGRTLPFILVSPQVPAGGDWDIGLLDALLDELLEKLPVDSDRVYLTGLSMGGHATWTWATRRPDRFAAIIPVCGSGQRYLACRLKTVPVWAFHGELDTVVPTVQSVTMVKAVQDCGGNARLTLYQDQGHDAWSETYANANIYEWLLRHRRGKTVGRDRE